MVDSLKGVSPENQQLLCFVYITFKAFSDGSSLPVVFTNFPYQGSDSDGIQAYNIIKNTPDITQALDNYLPSSVNSNLTLFNHEHSLGFQRKVSDLLDTHTCINQAAIVKFYRSDYNEVIDYATNTNYDRFDYVISDIRTNLDRGEITISFKNELLTDDVITHTFGVDSYVTDSYSEKAYGKTFPIAFGDNAQVKAELIAEAAYGFASLYNQHYNTRIKAVNSYYAKCKDGVYREVNSVSAVNTAFFSSYKGAASGTNSAFVDPQYAFEIEINPDSEGYIIDQGTIELVGNAANVVANGNITISIVKTIGGESDVTKYPNSKLTTVSSVQVPHTDYTAQIQTTAAFTLTYKFNEPAIIGARRTGESHKYFIMFKNSGLNITLRGYNTDGVHTPDSFLSYNSTNQSLLDGHYYYFAALTIQNANFTLKGLKFNEQLSGNSNTYPIAYFTVTAPTASEVDLNKLDFVLNVNGLCKTSDTTYYSDSPFKACKLLLGSQLDDTQYSNTHDVFDSSHAYYRKLGGALTGRVLLKQALQEICRNSASRLSPFHTTANTSNKLALWAWGTTLATSYEIDDTIMKSMSLQIGDALQVVNTPKAVYNRQLILQDRDDILNVINGGDRGYAGLLNLEQSSQSISIFGNRDLRDYKFDLIADSTSMLSVLEALTRQNDRPAKYIDFQLPYYPADSYALAQPLEVVELTTAKLPAYKGTASKPLPMTYDGQDLIRPDTTDLIRAKTYRALIISKTIRDLPELSIIVFKVKLLDNDLEIT